MNKQNNFNSIKLHFKETGFLPNDTAKGLLLFIISQTIVTLIYQVLYMIGFVHSIWSYVFTLILDACFVACVYNISKTKKLDFWSSIRARRLPKLKEVLIALGISIVCLFGFSALTNLFMELLYGLGYTSVSSDIVIPNFWYYLLYVLFICVVPAISEEILFRGLIANGLKRISTAVSIFGSSFLFMVMHGSPDQTVHQFILGIVLALVFLISDNIWVPILVHFFNNFIAVTFAYISYGASTDASSEVVEEATMYLGEYVIYAVISAVIAGSLIYLLLKALSNTQQKTKEVGAVELKDNTNEESVINPYINYNPAEYAIENEMGEVKIEEQGQEVEQVSSEIEPTNKLSGSGRTMYFISVAWLVIDWLSALVLGLTTIA